MRLGRPNCKTASRFPYAATARGRASTCPCILHTEMQHGRGRRYRLLDFLGRPPLGRPPLGLLGRPPLGLLGRPSVHVYTFEASFEHVVRIRDLLKSLPAIGSPLVGMVRQCLFFVGGLYLFVGHAGTDTKQFTSILYIHAKRNILAVS